MKQVIVQNETLVALLWLFDHLLILLEFLELRSVWNLNDTSIEHDCLLLRSVLPVRVQLLIAERLGRGSEYTRVRCWFTQALGLENRHHLLLLLSCVCRDLLVYRFLDSFKVNERLILSLLPWNRILTILFDIWGAHCRALNLRNWDVLGLAWLTESQVNHAVIVLNVGFFIERAILVLIIDLQIWDGFAQIRGEA